MLKLSRREVEAINIPSEEGSIAWAREKAGPLPSEEWIKQANEEAALTPDIWRIERYKTQLLFVCDEMQSNCHHHPLLCSQAKSCVAFSDTTFSMWKKRMGKESTAIPLRLEFQSGMAQRSVSLEHVKGEIHQIPPRHFIELDKIKQNGVQFRRVRTSFLVPHTTTRWSKQTGTFKEKTLDRVKAWMYIGIPEYWNDQIDEGFMFKTVQKYAARNPMIERYYCFSPKEYNDN